MSTCHEMDLHHAPCVHSTSIHLSPYYLSHFSLHSIAWALQDRARSQSRRSGEAPGPHPVTSIYERGPTYTIHQCFSRAMQTKASPNGPGKFSNPPSASSMYSKLYLKIDCPNSWRVSCSNYRQFVTHQYSYSYSSGSGRSISHTFLALSAFISAAGINSDVADSKLSSKLSPRAAAFETATAKGAVLEPGWEEACHLRARRVTFWSNANDLSFPFD